MLCTLEGVLEGFLEGLAVLVPVSIPDRALSATCICPLLDTEILAPLLCRWGDEHVNMTQCDTGGVKTQGRNEEAQQESSRLCEVQCQHCESHRPELRQAQKTVPSSAIGAYTRHLLL